MITDAGRRELGLITPREAQVMRTVKEIEEAEAAEHYERLLSSATVLDATGPAGRVPFGVVGPGGVLTTQQEAIAEQAVDRFIDRLNAWSQNWGKLTDADIAKARRMALADIGSSQPTRLPF